MLEREDVSECALRVHPEALHAAVITLGVEPLLFGTDAPLRKCGLQVEGLKAYGLSSDQLLAIERLNTERLLSRWQRSTSRSRNGKHVADVSGHASERSSAHLNRGEIFSRSTATAGLLKNRLPGILQQMVCSSSCSSRATTSMSVLGPLAKNSLPTASGGLSKSKR